MKIREQRYAVEPIHNATPHPKNAKRGDLEAIEASIAVNGFFGAIYVQDSTGLIVVGNHRWRAAVNRGATEIPVIRIVCSDIEAERMAVADNRTAELGTYDQAALLEQLERIAADADGSLAGTGFSDEAFAALEAEVAELVGGDTGGDDGDDADASGDGDAGGSDADDDLAKLRVPTEPITKRGDLWLLGEHRLLCGDTFDAEDRKRLLGNETIDLVLMDPPFAIYGSSTGIGTDIADDKMIQPFFENLFRIVRASVKEFAHVYTCCDWRSYATLWNTAKLAGLTAKNCIIWDKGSSGLGSNYANTYEMIFYSARLPPPTAMKSTTKRGQRTVYAPNVARYNRVTGAEREHNAAKPVALFEWFIGNSSDAGDLVVDFFGGSGTTIIAAEKTKRRACAMEMEPKYCDIIVARWERLTGRRAQRVPSGEAAPVPPTTRKRKAKAAAEDAPPAPEPEGDATP